MTTHYNDGSKNSNIFEDVMDAILIDITIRRKMGNFTLLIPFYIMLILFI